MMKIDRVLKACVIACGVLAVIYTWNVRPLPMVQPASRPMMTQQVDDVEITDE